MGAHLHLPTGDQLLGLDKQGFKEWWVGQVGRAGGHLRGRESRMFAGTRPTGLRGFSLIQALPLLTLEDRQPPRCDLVGGGAHVLPPGQAHCESAPRVSVQFCEMERQSRCIK